jgi:uracil-DNA glycosylase family 4
MIPRSSKSPARLPFHSDVFYLCGDRMGPPSAPYQTQPPNLLRTSPKPLPSIQPPLPKTLLQFPTSAADLDRIRDSITACELCPRLRDYCTRIGEVRRRAYQDHHYWSRPVPGFGDPRARVLILGLAPGAHGANRTGRPFTGDGSGDFMYPVLHELGFASKPRAISRDDGLRLRHAWIASVVRCAPPGDKPTPQEIRNRSVHLAAEINALQRVRVVVCLGKIAWDGFLAHLLLTGVIVRRSDYTFAHGADYELPNGLHLLGSYHPSLRNTNTGRLNRTMFARVFVRARELAGLR